MLQTAAFLGLDLVAPAHACCGLPAWQAGDVLGAKEAARSTVDAFTGFEAVVAASPSCLHMIQQRIPELLAGSERAAAAHDMAKKTSTWTRFLVESGGIDQIDLRFEGRILYFRPCSVDHDRGASTLLTRIQGAQILPAISETCCGFGGNLVWRHPDVSRAIAAAAARALLNSRADLVLSDDVGCVIRLAPMLKAAEGPPMVHLAEFIALSLP